MPVAAKALWTVHAGILLGLPEPRFTKTWSFNNNDAQETFARYRDEAAAYALKLQDPAMLNWVTLNFVWM